MQIVVQMPLPVDAHVDAIVEHARRERFAVVVAPPGSGKTTRIPPALASIGRTILLQPRRVAARALARRIAQERGWTIGNEIGWQIRFERHFSSRTQLLVATEGILTARLQSDPLLSDFRVVVLDEFHERSIHADLALALVKEAAASRDDLAVIVMSATIDASAVSRYLNDARVYEIGAPRFPVDIQYKPGASIADSLASLPIVTWVLENNDVTRIVTRFGPREARAAALLLLALPGPVFLYQGQELPSRQQQQIESLVSQATGKPIHRTTRADPLGFGLGLGQLTSRPVGTVWYYEGETLGNRGVVLRAGESRGTRAASRRRGVRRAARLHQPRLPFGLNSRRRRLRARLLLFNVCAARLAQALAHLRG